MTDQREHLKDGQSHDKEHAIIVNARERVVSEKELSFEQIIELAYPGSPANEKTYYTVTYKKGEDHKPEGTMVEGDVVKIKSGMIFNVTATDKS